MKIFLCHASEDKATADSIAFSLRARGHQVFLDRDKLPAGASYDQQIERAVKASDIFIFLISPESVAQRRYTLTELEFARHKWPSPNAHVLPVMVRMTPLEQVPAYLKAVTILEPVGNVTAETSATVDAMRVTSTLWLVFAVGTGTVGAVILIFALLVFGPGGNQTRIDQLNELIAQMYSELPADRTAAYDSIMRDFNTHPALVPALLQYAAQRPNNPNGVFNTVRTLQYLNRKFTQPHKAEINRFCGQAERIGDRTKAECDILRRGLEQ
jgi:hypothetical protein